MPSSYLAVFSRAIRRSTATESMARKNTAITTVASRPRIAVTLESRAVTIPVAVDTTVDMFSPESCSIIMSGVTPKLPTHVIMLL